MLKGLREDWEHLILFLAILCVLGRQVFVLLGFMKTSNHWFRRKRALPLCMLAAKFEHR